MAISYQGAFEKMKEAGISTYRIRKEKIVSEGTLQSMREGRPVSTETIFHFLSVDRYFFLFLRSCC